MEDLDEGDRIAVFLEIDGTIFNTSDRVMDWLPSGDMGVEVLETMVASPVFFSPLSTAGKFSVRRPHVPFPFISVHCSDFACQKKLGTLSIRKRKGGSVGKKAGALAFKTLASSTFELQKFIGCSAKASSLCLPLSWKDEGTDQVGLGAEINCVVMVDDMVSKGQRLLMIAVF